MPLAKLGDQLHPTAFIVNSNIAKTSTATFNRAGGTTQYTANDVIGSADTANHEIPNIGNAGSVIEILTAELIINNTSVPGSMTTFKLHVWDSSPAAIADNAPFAAAAGERAKYYGVISLPQIVAVGGGFLYTFDEDVKKVIKLTSSSLYVNLVTDGGYIPTDANQYIIRITAKTLGN